MPTPQNRKPRGKRAELAAWLAAEHPAEVGEPQWDALRRDLAPLSRSYLRKLLRETGVPLSALVEGVRQENFDQLERSLRAMLKEYEAGDAARRAEVRKLVIEAKDHARWAAKNPEKKAQKEEMALWLLTWLENPPLFAEWVTLRRMALSKHGDQT
jgi:hypothetical protein